METILKGVNIAIDRVKTSISSGNIIYQLGYLYYYMLFLLILKKLTIKINHMYEVHDILPSTNYIDEKIKHINIQIETKRNIKENEYSLEWFETFEDLKSYTKPLTKSYESIAFETLRELDNVDIYQTIEIILNHRFLTKIAAIEEYEKNQQNALEIHLSRGILLKQLFEIINTKVINYFTLKTLYYMNKKAYTIISNLQFSLLLFKDINAFYIKPNITLSPFIVVLTLAYGIATEKNISTCLGYFLNLVRKKTPLLLQKFNKNDTLETINNLNNIIHFVDSLSQIIPDEDIQNINFKLPYIHKSLNSIRSYFNNLLSNKLISDVEYQSITLITIACDIMQSNIALQLLKNKIPCSILQRNDKCMVMKYMRYNNKNNKCICTSDEILSSALDHYIPFYSYHCIPNSERTKIKNDIIDEYKILTTSKDAHELILSDNNFRKNIEYKHKIVMADAAYNSLCLNGKKHIIENLLNI